MSDMKRPGVARHQIARAAVRHRDTGPDWEIAVILLCAQRQCEIPFPREGLVAPKCATNEEH
jgi:hypothetical protein